MDILLFLLKTGNSHCQKFYFLIPQKGCGLVRMRQEDMRTRTMGRNTLAPSPPPTVCKNTEEQITELLLITLPSLIAGWNFTERHSDRKNVIKKYTEIIICVFIHSRKP